MKISKKYLYSFISKEYKQVDSITGYMQSHYYVNCS